MERHPCILRLTGVVVVLLVLVFHGTARAHEGPDYRSRFFEEVLTPEQTAWSHRFNAYEALERIAPRDGTEPEWLADFVFTRYGASGLVFGKFERNRIRSEALNKHVSPLLRSLRETYGHGQRPRVPSRRGTHSFAFGLLADVTAEPVPELDQALAPFGFAGFDDTVLSFGLGGDRRLEIGVRATAE